MSLKAGKRAFDGVQSIVTLLDCDGYSVVSGNGNYYPATPPAKGHAAPEVLKNKGVSAELAEAQDCFALALDLFQVFNYGVSPFSGRINKGWLEAVYDDARVAAGYYPYGLHPNPAINPLPRSVHDCLPVSLREMFDRAFREGKERPTAREWEEVLRGLTESWCVKTFEARRRRGMSWPGWRKLNMKFSGTRR